MKKRIVGIVIVSVLMLGIIALLICNWTGAFAKEEKIIGRPQKVLGTNAAEMSNDIPYVLNQHIPIFSKDTQTPGVVQSTIRTLFNIEREIDVHYTPVNIEGQELIKTILRPFKQIQLTARDPRTKDVSTVDLNLQNYLVYFERNDFTQIYLWDDTTVHQFQNDPTGENPDIVTIKGYTNGQAVSIDAEVSVMWDNPIEGAVYTPDYIAYATDKVGAYRNELELRYHLRDIQNGGGMDVYFTFALGLPINITYITSPFSRIPMGSNGVINFPGTGGSVKFNDPTYAQQYMYYYWHGSLATWQNSGADTYQDALNEQYWKGYNKGYDFGDSAGYQRGVSAQLSNNPIVDTTKSLLSTFINAINIKLFGFISIADIIAIVVILGLVGFLIKLIRG